jgi:hypothetical protein
MYTAMPRTYQRQKRTAAPAAITFSVPVLPILPKLPAGNQPTMAVSMPNAASFATSWPPPLKLKSAPYINSQTAEIFRTTLIEMGHPQPPTPGQTVNSTAYGIVNSSIRQRRSRAMDMRFYWVRDHVRQNHFLFYWKPGQENLGDYFTKHHPPAHHQTMRSTYLQVAQAALRSTTHKPNSVRGCVDSILPHTTQAHNLAHNLLRKLLRLTHLLKHKLNSLT